ncbi:hypothetical protein CORC01_11781 [Colletotrichum orchidophilum]|uniref:Uncharacterized protein n=1 Tax=Colletotrichum orchidophilum TaxID=1209926 RepID=A0A1G4AUU6_9PEZI|nr:uncharacterized protein CORC01_11781 [Colletotrichum orchidophilum]OHE92914.1 hypothetical protein CORC01_11781 [Colletotrichum orchidophilum]
MSSYVHTSFPIEMEVDSPTTSDLSGPLLSSFSSLSLGVPTPQAYPVEMDVDDFSLQAARQAFADYKKSKRSSSNRKNPFLTPLSSSSSSSSSSSLSQDRPKNPFAGESARAKRDDSRKNPFAVVESSRAKPDGIRKRRGGGKGRAKDQQQPKGNGQRGSRKTSGQHQSSKPARRPRQKRNQKSKRNDQSVNPFAQGANPVPQPKPQNPFSKGGTYNP